MPLQAPRFSSPFAHLGILLFLFTRIDMATAGVPISVDACTRLSEGAKISQTKVLVIGYEGLFSSSPINANLLSNYREKLATGQKASRPFYLFGGSFLTRGPLTRIVESYKNKVQVLVFGRTGQTNAESLPGKCATIWMQEKGAGTEGRKVIIVGHSFGGGAAWELANSLRGKNVKVDAVVTADPRSPMQCMGECWNWSKPSNVTYWSNHYQRGILRGHEVPGANNQYHGNYSHGTIQNAPAFYQAIANRIDGVNGPAVTAAPIYTKGNQNPGRGGAVNPSSISGRSGTNDNLNPPPGLPQGPSMPLGPATNNFLRALARNSPSRSREEEERWFKRASGSDSSGGSVLANKIPNGPVIPVQLHSEVNGNAPKNGEETSPEASAQGTVLPSNGLAETAAMGNRISAQRASSDRTPAESSTSKMLNGLWPLTKGESPPAGSYRASEAIADTIRLESKEGGIAEPHTMQSAQLDNVGAVSLFRRVHLKHELWFKMKGRF